MSHFFESGFSYRQPMWHGLGTVIEERPKNVYQALKLAELEWRVEGQPLYYKSTRNDNTLFIPDKKALVRDDTDMCLGVVSSKYEEIQNDALMSFVYTLLKEGGAKLETAGSLKGGRLVWALADLEDYTIEIGGVEEELTKTYLLATSSHDGSSACKVMVTKVRVVCFNTLSMALGAADNVYTIRHIGYVDSRVREARDSLGLALKWDKSITKALEFMADEKCDNELFQELVEQVWWIDEEEATEETMLNNEEKRNELEELFDKFNDQGSPLAGTKYAALQAVTEQQDYFAKVRGDTEYEVNERLFTRFIKQETLNAKGAAFNVLLGV